MKLERGEVVRTAIRLLDEVGLEGLSLRRLAKELGVQAPALYWHFKNKQELLDHMVSEMARTAENESRPVPGQTWDEWLVDRARWMRTGLLSHRDLVLLTAGTRPTADRAPAIEEMVRVLCDAGFTPGEAVLNILVITDYVTGAVLEEQAGRRRDDDGLERLEGGPQDQPLLDAAIKEINEMSDSFEYGLSLLIDGMRARLASRSAD
jgi:TetR/AcrR family tetracycline transcriptional repressor